MIVSRHGEIDVFLNSPPSTVRAALIYGRDLAIVRERAEILAARVTERPDDPFDVAVLSESDMDGGGLEGALAAFSLMGGRRLVRLTFVGDKIGPDRAAAETLATHLDGGFNPDAFLLIEAGALGKDSALKRVAEKAPACMVVPCYEDEIGDLTRFTREALAADRVGMTAEALELFVSRLPRERGPARREIERLVLFLGPGRGGSASAPDLEAFLGIEPGASLADAASDAFGGRLGRAYAALRCAGQAGEDGAAAVRALSSHLARLRRIITLHEAGVGLPAAAKAAKVFWKDEKEVLRQARSWTLADLDRLEPDFLRADQACKQTGSPDRLLAEHLSLTVAGRARRMGL
jgi:DNA polymerase-3 subunit delta